VCDWFEIKQVVDADASFAPSQLIAEAFARLEGVRPAVIRSPDELELPEIDRSFFEKNRPALPFLLYFGQLSRIKGVDVLARAAGRVLARHPQLAVVFIGRDDGLPNGTTCREYILAQCSGSTDRVRVLEPLPKERLFAFVEEALGVVLPSRVDNFPNACLEAQLLGRPVVGTYGSSLDEMIVDGQTGFLSANADDADLERAIERLLAMDADQRAAMRRALAKEVARRRAEDYVGELIEFYASVVDNFGAHREHSGKSVDFRERQSRP
jgi:glycosyltransferase involved in cell wall biosynthesis